MNPQGPWLEQLTQALGQVAGQGQQIKDSVQEAMKQLIKQRLAELDMVSREEFEQQQAILKATEQRLEQLSQRLSALEQAPSSADKP